MSIPAVLIKELTDLQAQVAAAQPLSSAPRADLKAIELNAETLEINTTLALYNAAGGLDTWVAPRDQIGIIAGVQTAVQSSVDQWKLLDMLEVVSRAVLNIDLMIGDIGTANTRTMLIPS
jgi:hypothetical protein